MKSFKWIISYSLFAVLGIFTAFYIVSGVVMPSKAQISGPDSGELPPEVLAGEQIPVSPVQAVPNSSEQVPMPPPESQMEGENVTAENNTPVFTDSDYVYEYKGGRDPFEPYKKYKPNLKKTETIITDPLQLHPVDSFTVLGILWEVNKPRAMVKDPNGVVYVITKNTKIGKNEGYVAAIREGEVVVVETLYDEGAPSKQTVVLSIKK